MGTIPIRIISARYESGTDFVDVVGKVEELSQEGFFYVGARLGDPFPNRGKSLRVVYEVGGKRYEDVVPEHGMFVAKPLTVEGVENDNGHEFSVESAIFGANNYVDFTAVAKGIFKNPFDHFEIAVPGERYGNPFPDPEHGVTKYYVIRFTFKSRTFLSVSREFDSTVRLLTPLFSVIIPTWNRAEFLPRCVGSVMAQDLLPRSSMEGYPGRSRIEVIVVDDGSTDNTREVMLGISKDYPDVTYLRIPHTGCVGIVRNLGVRISTGKFIAYLDSDDKYYPFHLSKLYERFMATDAMIIRTQSHFCRLRVLPDGSIQENLEIDFGKAVYNRWNTYTSSRAYRRELLDLLVPNVYPGQQWPMAAKCTGEDELFYDVVDKLGVRKESIEEQTILYGLIYRGNNVTYSNPRIASEYRDKEVSGG